MKQWTVVTALLTIAAFGSAGQESAKSHSDPEVMLAAVSRDESSLSGGISSSKWTRRGTVVVEPLARLTASGSWIAIPCSSNNRKDCPKFARDYLSKPQIYTVISADGKGATIHAKPTTLSECFDYSGTGSYSGGVIANSAIAASSANMFGESEPLRPLSRQDASPILSLLAAEVPKKLDSIQYLRLFSMELEGKGFYVVQRPFAENPQYERRGLIFGIGDAEPHRFHFLHWKQNTEDESERVLGTIRLKSGHDFLITVVNDPESHFFRVYGIKGGHLALIYSGGGASC